MVKNTQAHMQCYQMCADVQNSGSESQKGVHMRVELFPALQQKRIKNAVFKVLERVTRMDGVRN